MSAQRKDDRPLSIAYREDRVYGGHVLVSVFVGRNPGSRGRAGVLTLRLDEWLELQAMVAEDIRITGAGDHWHGLSDVVEILEPLEEARRAVLGVVDPAQGSNVTKLPTTHAPEIERAEEGERLTLVGWDSPNDPETTSTWHVANGGATVCGISYADDALEPEFLEKTEGELEREAFQVCWPCQVKWHDGGAHAG